MKMFRCSSKTLWQTELKSLTNQLLFLCCWTLLADRTDRAYNLHFTLLVLFSSYCFLSILYEKNDNKFSLEQDTKLN